MHSLLLRLATAVGINPSPWICRDVVLPVNISATSAALPDSYSVQSVLGYATMQFSQLVNSRISGTYNIYGQFCAPSDIASKNGDILQLLVHGAASDHHFWNAYDFEGEPYHGSNYSWVQSAWKHGYPTFAIDRLGSGQSDHPDPYSVVHLPAQVEVAHAVVEAIKSGALGRTFSEVVYFGQSYGSIIGQVYAAKYPLDVKRMLLFAWAPITPKMLGSYVTRIFNSKNTTAPARNVDPARFGHLPKGYEMSWNETHDIMQNRYGYATEWAGKYYDPEFALREFDVRMTTTVAEGLSLMLAPVSASDFKGKVLAVTGRHDAFFCGRYNSADCGTGNTSVFARGQSFAFPHAASYDYISVANAGHDWFFHYGQHEYISQVYEWLDKTR